jgi:hypothetical protein
VARIVPGHQPAAKENSEKLSHAFVNAQSIRRTRESFKAFPVAGRRPSHGNSKILFASKNSASKPTFVFVAASGFAGDINTTRARQDALRGNAASVSKT